MTSAHHNKKRANINRRVSSLKPSNVQIRSLAHVYSDAPLM